MTLQDSTEHIAEFLRESRGEYEEISKRAEGEGETYYAKGRYHAYSDVLAWLMAECRDTPSRRTHHGQWEWDASHYDEIAVRIHQGGGCIVWYRKLHTSGRKRWHKLVPHPDGSPRDHWLEDREHVFIDWMRAASAKAVPVAESPFADQSLYDEIAERSEQSRLCIEQHRERMLEEAIEDG